jgi:putative ABC transport system substrate-binding protein
MDRRRFLVASVTGALAVPLIASAQTPERLRRVGVVSAASARIGLNDAFDQALAELGWIHGRNIGLDYRFARLDRPTGGSDVAALAAELIGRGAEVLVTYSPQVTQAVKNAVTTIPIVFAFVGDPVGLGLVASLGRPGGNVTGVTQVARELQGKRLQLLKDAIPRLSRVGALVNPASGVARVLLSETERAARALAIDLHVEEATGPDDFARAFSVFARARTDAVMVIPDTLFFFHQKRLAELAALHRLPSMHHEPEAPPAGAFMAYGESSFDHIRRQAVYVDKVLRGATASELPVEQPTTFQLVLNLKTATALGLAIPSSILARADKVIE